MYLEVQIFWVFNVLKKFQENLFGKGDMAWMIWYGITRS